MAIMTSNFWTAMSLGRLGWACFSGFVTSAVRAAGPEPARVAFVAPRPPFRLLRRARVRAWRALAVAGAVHQHVVLRRLRPGDVRAVAGGAVVERDGHRPRRRVVLPRGGQSLRRRGRVGVALRRPHPAPRPTGALRYVTIRHNTLRYVTIRAEGGRRRHVRAAASHPAQTRAPPTRAAAVPRPPRWLCCGGGDGGGDGGGGTAAECKARSRRCRTARTVRLTSSPPTSSASTSCGCRPTEACWLNEMADHTRRLVVAGEEAEAE